MSPNVIFLSKSQNCRVVWRRMEIFGDVTFGDSLQLLFGDSLQLLFHKFLHSSLTSFFLFSHYPHAHIARVQHL